MHTAVTRKINTRQSLGPMLVDKFIYKFILLLAPSCYALFCWNGTDFRVC